MKNNQAGMSLIVKTITRLTVGLILIYGIYIVLRGHISPGGGFAGGVIIALSFIHLMLAFGKNAVVKKINEPGCIFWASFGAVIFLFAIYLSFSGKRYFSGKEAHFKILSSGIIPLCDIAVSVLVGAGLFVIFYALILLAERKEEK